MRALFLFPMAARASAGLRTLNYTLLVEEKKQTNKQKNIYIYIIKKKTTLNLKLVNLDCDYNELWAREALLLLCMPYPWHLHNWIQSDLSQQRSSCVSTKLKKSTHKATRWTQTGTSEVPHPWFQASFDVRFDKGAAPQSLSVRLVRFSRNYTYTYIYQTRRKNQ